MNPYRIIKGLLTPKGRPAKRQKLDNLISLASEMNLGDAAVLSSSDAQTLRTILAAQGFKCISDGYRCDTPGRTLVFKLPINPLPVLEVHHEPDDFRRQRFEQELCTDCRQPTPYWLTPHLPLCTSCCEARNKAQPGAGPVNSVSHS